MSVDTSTPEWHEANQRYLVARLHVLSGLLEPGSVDAEQARRAVDEAAAAMSIPPALSMITADFALSPFEEDLLLMCAGVELDSRFAELCAAAQGAPRRPQPTFSLALAVLPHAHWSALGPGAPLRRFHLVELGPGDSLTRSPLRVDERMLHLMVGVDQPDERLMGLLEQVRPSAPSTPSQRQQAERLIEQWRFSVGQGAAPVENTALVELWGGDRRARRDLAVATCAVIQRRLEVLDASVLAARTDLERVGPLLVRELIMGGSGLLIETDGLETVEPARAEAVRRLIDQLPGLILVSSRERTRLGQRLTVSMEVERPSETERIAQWREALDFVRGRVGKDQAPSVDDSLIEPLVAAFDLEGPAIHAACAMAVADSSPGSDVGAMLWESCRVRARSELEGLAQRIDTAASWDDLVLPEASLQQLRHMAGSLRHRPRVHGAWGFSERSERGLGVGALFVGPSGTGKTLAAEVLAAELRLDLYRIDLSQVVSKYIGETEKNLRRIFEAAERGSAILLFDEADALFGRRGEVRSSQDRYANLEIAYLLQRMEAYRGLAILTTNLERALDPAFLRRLRFVVRFPLPGAAERATLWQRAFPPRTPTEGLEIDRLAQMGLTGGSIRNIAIRAAFLAAEAGTPVRMAQVLEAAQAEYEKLGRAPGRSEGDSPC